MKSQNFNPAALAIILLLLLLLHPAPLSAQPSQNPPASGLNPAEQQYLQTLSPAQLGQLMQLSPQNPIPVPALPPANPPAVKKSAGFFANLASSAWRMVKQATAYIFGLFTAILGNLLTPHDKKLWAFFEDKVINTEFGNFVVEFFTHER